MSDGLHPDLLRWVHGSGIARRHGREVTLREAPDLGHGRVHEVWFDPALSALAYATDLGGRHELDDQERQEAMRALREAVPSDRVPL